MSFSTLQFREALANGPYAWPGGYPLFFVTVDGSALCYACAQKEKARIVFMARTWKSWPNDGFRVADVDVNWEDPELYCDHCSERIPSAYAEPES